MHSHKTKGGMGSPGKENVSNGGRRKKFKKDHASEITKDHTGDIGPANEEGGDGIVNGHE